MNQTKRIAICGTRGVPANYGGFETFAEELGSRLVKNGFEVIVYCRHYEKRPANECFYTYKGMKCISIRAFKHKYLDTPVHTLFCFLNPSMSSIDTVLLCNAANSPFAFIPRLRGKKLLINVDGIERERRKWNWLGKLWYFFGEFCSVLFATDIVTDAIYIQEYYKKKYRSNSSVIRYGAKHLNISFAEQKISGDFSQIYEKHKDFFKSFNLNPGKYLLYVSRLEPENNADKVILAYNDLDENLRQEFPLVIVGDAPYAEAFKSWIREISAPEVRFLGYQFGDNYEILQTGAHLYFQATEVGGTHPALLEAMGFANAIIANTVPEHIEVVEDVAELYKFNNINDLTSLICRLLSCQQRVFDLRRLAFKKAIAEYSWEAICEQYLALIGR